MEAVFLRFGIGGLKENILALKLIVRIFVHIAVGMDAEASIENRRFRGSQGAGDFRISPNVESAFALLVRMRGVNHTIRIFGRVEPAVWMR